MMTPPKNDAFDVLDAFIRGKGTRAEARWAFRTLKARDRWQQRMLNDAQKKLGNVVTVLEPIVRRWREQERKEGR